MQFKQLNNITIVPLEIVLVTRNPDESVNLKFLGRLYK